MGSRIYDTSDTGGNEECYLNAFIRESVIPRQIGSWKYAAQLDVIHIVGFSNIAVVVYLYHAFVVTHQVRLGVQVAQGTSFFQYELSLCQTSSVRRFQFKTVFIDNSTCFGMYVVLYQLDKLVLVG